MLIHSLRNFKNPGYIYLLGLVVVFRIIPIFGWSIHQEVVIFEPYIKSILPISFSFLSTPWVNISLAGVLVYLQAIILNQILIKYNIFPKPSFLPALSYILLNSLFTIFLTLQPVLIANFFMLWLLDRLFSIYKTDQPITRAFDIGLIIACGTLIYFPFMILLPILWIGLSIFLPFSWRAWLSGLCGFLILYLFIGVYFFMIDNMNRFLLVFKPLNFNNPAYLPIYGAELWILLPILFCLIMGLYYYRIHTAKSLILIKKSLQLLVFIFGLSTLGYFLQPVVLQNLGFTFAFQARHTLLHFLIWVCPLSIYMAYYFIFARKRWIYELVFLGIFILVVYFQVNSYFQK